MTQHIVASGFIGMSLWGALLANKTGAFLDRICAAIALALGLFFYTTQL